MFPIKYIDNNLVWNKDNVVHIRTSDNISYYISSARRTQGRKCE